MIGIVILICSYPLIVMLNGINTLMYNNKEQLMYRPNIIPKHIATSDNLRTFAGVSSRFILQKKKSVELSC